MRASSLMVVGLFLAVAGVAHAIRPAPARVHFQLKKVTVTKQAPDAVDARARTVWEAVVAGRPDLAPSAKRGVKSYAVTLHLDSYERSVARNTKEGASGQVLTVKVGVQIVGTTPGGVMAFAGSGQSTVMAETGENVRPREDENALDEALRDALGRALNQAVSELRAKKLK